MPASERGSEASVLEQPWSTRAPPIEYRALRWLQAESHVERAGGWRSDGFAAAVSFSNDSGPGRITQFRTRQLAVLRRKRKVRPRSVRALSRWRITPSALTGGRLTSAPRVADAEAQGLQARSGSLLLSEPDGHLRRYRTALQVASFGQREMGRRDPATPVAHHGAVESCPSRMRVAGLSTFVMTYEYEMVNGAASTPANASLALTPFSVPNHIALTGRPPFLDWPAARHFLR